MSGHIINSRPIRVSVATAKKSQNSAMVSITHLGENVCPSSMVFSEACGQVGLHYRWYPVGDTYLHLRGGNLTYLWKHTSYVFTSLSVKLEATCPSLR